MEYSIKALSELAGVSTRTLRYYDEIGLLKPLRVSDAGYRFYGKQELALLQQILFYRERGFELKKIREIVCKKDFDVVKAMEEHLLELENQKTHVEHLIQTVKQSLQHLKGECDMSDREKFREFKEQAVRENEAVYGAEARRKYGDEAVDASNRAWLDMSEDTLKTFQNLEKEILARLEAAVRNGVVPESEEVGQIVRLHKKWISMAWGRYDVQAHRGVAAMYVADARFTDYYDHSVQGCAKLLNDAVQRWAVKL